MKPLFKFSIALTPDQVKYMKPLAEVYRAMEEASAPGAIIAQIYPEGETDKLPPYNHTLPRIDMFVIPSYKAKMIGKILHKEPTGEIKRRDYFKTARKIIERMKANGKNIQDN
jgi:hypothetical protein